MKPQKPLNTIDPLVFAKFLWGELYYDEATRKFKRKAMSEGGAELPRSFVHFVLEPFYKIMAVSISEEKAQLSPILSRLGVYLNKKDYHMDIKPLVKLILRKLLGDLSCVIDSLVHCVPNAADSTATKVKHFYQGEDGHTLTKCDPKGPLSVSITKLFNNEAAQTFYAFGRVMSGTLKAG
jgi:116 kDa U5 small nuclear ribonucleoprotein component